jgi:hypothetical protein
MAMQPYGLTQFNPMQVDQARAQNRLRTLRADQAEMEMDRQNRLMDLLGGGGSSGGSSGGQRQGGNRLRNAAMEAGGGPTRRAASMMDQAQPAAQTGGGMDQSKIMEIMALDPQLGSRIQEMRASQAEAQRVQEDQEAAIIARFGDRLRDVEGPQRAQVWQNLKQRAAQRGYDVSDWPETPDENYFTVARARAQSADMYEPPEQGGGGYELRSVGDNLVRANPQTGEVETLMAAQGGGQADTQRQRKINDLASRQDVQGAAEAAGVPVRDMAQDIVDGYRRIEVVPQTGNVRLINEISGEVTELPIGRANQRGQGGQAQGGDDDPASTAQALDQAEIPPGQLNQQTAQEGSTLWESTEGVAGIPGAITEAWQRTGGQIPGLGGGEETRETVGNRQFFRLAQGDLIRSLSINPRFPVAEMERIRRETDIEPSMWDSQDSLKTRMRRLDKYLRGRLERERQAAKNPNMGQEARANAQRAAKDIANFLDVLGVPREGQGQRGAQTEGAVGQRRDNRQQSSGLTPDRIRSMSRERLNRLSQDTSNLSQEQLEAAAERYEQLQQQGR